MQLLTQDVIKHIPSLYETEDASDPIVRCKFFTPWSYWTWYVIEFDGADLCYGYVKGDFPELGYFRLSELKALKGPFGLTVERDIYFTPVPLSKVTE